MRVRDERPKLRVAIAVDISPHADIVTLTALVRLAKRSTEGARIWLRTKTSDCKDDSGEKCAGASAVNAERRKYSEVSFPKLLKAPICSSWRKKTRSRISSRRFDVVLKLSLTMTVRRVEERSSVCRFGAAARWAVGTTVSRVFAISSAVVVFDRRSPGRDEIPVSVQLTVAPEDAMVHVGFGCALESWIPVMTMNPGTNHHVVSAWFLAAKNT